MKFNHTFNDEAAKGAFFYLAKEERETALHFAKVAANFERGTEFHILAITIFLDYMHEARRKEDDLIRETLNLEF
jgi:hypothetical protein